MIYALTRTSCSWLITTTTTCQSTTRTPFIAWVVILRRFLSTHPPQSSRESERANKLENDSIKHTDEIKKLKLQLANCQTTMESSDAKLRGLQSSESSLEKRLNSSHSNHDAIKLLESRLDSANSNLKDATTDKVATLAYSTTTSLINITDAVI